jgi:phosphohistidine phosphatase
MNLYLMRHGIALPADDPAVAVDAERPLSPKGVKRTRKIAKGMRRLDLSFDVLLTSPLARAANRKSRRNRAERRSFRRGNFKPFA